MIGYGPAAQAIRAERGLPYATGADEPPDWHNHPGMTGPDDPDTSHEQPRPCNRRNAHTNHSACPGTAPEFPWEAVEEVTE